MFINHYYSLYHCLSLSLCRDGFVCGCIDFQLLNNECSYSLFYFSNFEDYSNYKKENFYRVRLVGSIYGFDCCVHDEISSKRTKLLEFDSNFHQIYLDDNNCNVIIVKVSHA